MGSAYNRHFVVDDRCWIWDEIVVVGVGVVVHFDDKEGTSNEALEGGFRCWYCH